MALAKWHCADFPDLLVTHFSLFLPRQRDAVVEVAQPTEPCAFSCEPLRVRRKRSIRHQYASIQVCSRCSRQPFGCPSAFSGKSVCALETARVPSCCGVQELVASDIPLARGDGWIVQRHCLTQSVKYL